MENEETLVTEGQTTTPPEPPPVIDPWAHLSPEEKIDREMAYRQSQTPKEEAVVNPFADDEYATTVYDQTRKAAVDDAMRAVKQQYGTAFEGMAKTHAFNTASQGLPPEAIPHFQKVWEDATKGQSAQTLAALAENKVLIDTFRKAALHDASKAGNQGDPNGARVAAKVDGLDDQIARFKQLYGMDLPREEAEKIYGKN